MLVGAAVVVAGSGCPGSTPRLDLRGAADSYVANPRRDQGTWPDASGVPGDGSAGGQDRGGASSDGGCVCPAGTEAACGPCGSGRKVCKADCSGYGDCVGAPKEACEPGTKVGCPNGCGEKTCEASCRLGPCSQSQINQGYLKAGPKNCFSSNHCGVGQGRCVACWLKCDGDGNLVEDGWCSGGSCTACTNPNPNCP